MQALDLLANNLANATTGGYKLDREFYSLFAASDEVPIEGENALTKLPVIQKQWTDFSQGTLQPTGGDLDLSLSGQGFFVVNGPSGPLYTRNGAFQQSKTGELTTTEGYPVRAAGGTTIQLGSKGPVKVAPDGTIEQDGQTIGQLEIVNFEDRAILAKVGNSYFRNTSTTAQPAPAPEVSVMQGKIEGSNVTAAESAVRLVGVMRQFEMLQKAVTLTSDMDKKALDEVARVGAGV
jgi:flagellar basal-body rod protein FlgF